MTFNSIADVARANKENGQKWFSPDTMAFFSSRIETDLIHGEFFITSEENNGDDDRRYNIRRVKWDADIDTVGDYNEHLTLEDAISALLEYVQSDEYKQEDGEDA